MTGEELKGILEVVSHLTSNAAVDAEESIEDIIECAGESEIDRVRTYSEAMMLTNDDGVVITDRQGREYAITIQRKS